MLVNYLNDNFEPVSADEATLVKIIKEDGTVIFARPMKKEPEGSDD